MRRNFCQACLFAYYGVKTRIAIEHTCGLEKKPWYERKPVSLPSSNNAELQAKKLSNENTSGEI